MVKSDKNLPDELVPALLLVDGMYIIADFAIYFLKYYFTYNGKIFALRIPSGKTE